MPKFLENKLKAEYGQNSAIPYKVMNSIGAMRGNQETPKGARMQAQHVRDVKAGVASGMPKLPRVTTTPSVRTTVTPRMPGVSVRPTSHPGRNLGKFLHPPKVKL